MKKEKVIISIVFLAFLASLLMGCSKKAKIHGLEHPRPDFKRQEWLNLNGSWKFDFDPENVGEKEGWFEYTKHNFTKRITVPFPWEAPLSGIGNYEYKGVAWYQRLFELPKSWSDKRVFLKFGALDWEGIVWVNDKFVGEHQGGYTPFEFDITDKISWEAPNTLTVRAFDPTEPWQPTGKQIHWYTRTSGIWQAVYLESCPSAIYIKKAHILPNIDNKTATFKLKIHNNSSKSVFPTLILKFKKHRIRRYKHSAQLEVGDNQIEFTIPIKNAKLWSPEKPDLYEVSILLRGKKRLLDRVDTYFGMRKISTRKWGSHDFEYVFLNNKPYYLIGALNQAFNPEGIYTYPNSDHARLDIKRAKSYGFNFLRLHIKIDEPRLLYWADKLGILLMCDIPNFWEDSPRARQAYEKTLIGAIERDFNHPSIIAWCLFNETWGLGFSKEYSSERQDWVAARYLQAKALDPTRLVEDMSPCHYDHVKTDINSWHFYINDYERAKEHIQNIADNTFPGSTFNFIGGNRQSTQPLINSEYGGISAGLGDQDISWCFKYLTNELRKHKKIGGYIYTELQDIEWEHNGFMDYDRKQKIFGYDEICSGFSYSNLNNPDFLVIDAPPCPHVAPKDEFALNIYGSHYSNAEPLKGKLCWKLYGWNIYGKFIKILKNCHPVTLKPYDVVKLSTVSFKLPPFPFLGTLDVCLKDKRGKVIARNYINIDVIPQDLSFLPRQENKNIIVRFLPEDFEEAKWAGDTLQKNGRGMKVAGLGSGIFTYTLELPDELRRDKIRKIILLFEAAAKAPVSEKVDARFPEANWSKKKPLLDYPQTDATKWPSDVTVSFNDVEIKTITLPDDPADAKGILSHVQQQDPGSYGYLQKVTVKGKKLKQILSRGDKLRLSFEVKADAVHRGGFALFGHRMGRYPLPPTVIFKK